MAITREEAVVQIGVDSTTVARDLTGVQNYIEHFGDKMVGKFNRLLGVSIWHEALGLVATGIDMLTKHWLDMYYNVDAAAAVVFAALNKHWHELRGNADRAGEAQEKAMAAFRMLNATEAGKKVIIQEELAANEKRLNWAKQLLEIAQEGVKAAIRGNLSAEQRAAFTENQVVAATNVNKLEAERLGIMTKLDSVQDRLNEEAEKERAKVRKDRDEAIEAYDKREKAELKFLELAARESFTAATKEKREVEKFMPSLSEVAQSRSRASGYAKSIEWLGEAAKQQFENFGFQGRGAELVKERNRRYDELAKAGFVAERPEKVAEAQIKTADVLERIASGDITIQTALELVND